MGSLGGKIYDYQSPKKQLLGSRIGCWTAEPDCIGEKTGGDGRNRTGVHGFAIRCVTTPPRRLPVVCFERLVSLAKASDGIAKPFSENNASLWPSGRKVSRRCSGGGLGVCLMLDSYERGVVFACAAIYKPLAPVHAGV